MSHDAVPALPRLRVLMIADPYVPVIGGLEHHVRELSRELVRRGHQVTVATTSHPDAPRFEVDDGVRVHRIGGWSRALAPFYESERRFHPTFPDPGTMIALRRLVASERPDVVHAHSWMLYSFLPLKTWSGARLVVTLHDHSLICAKKTYLHRGAPCSGPAYTKCVRCAASQYGVIKSLAVTTGLRVSSPLHRNVDRFTAASRAVARAVAEATALPEPDVLLTSFIPDDAAERAAYHRRPGFLPPHDDFILFVGAMGPHKGLDVLLEAWLRVDPRPPLVLLGTRRKDTPVHVPAGVSVAWDVRREEVMAAWASCLIAVVPSRTEGGGPTVLLEAMASGRPVVASAVGAAPELVTHGVDGLLVPPGDVDALSDALRALLQDVEMRQRLGRAARERARAFTLRAAADRVEQLYTHELAARR